MACRKIELRGVGVHNLKHVDLDIPQHQLVVICGVSGSGKTSLALDTLYAEGQRRYIESFSLYTRQFLERLDKPAAERIDGIPAVDRRDARRRFPLQPGDDRHGDRDDRLPAAAVCQDRPAGLPARAARPVERARPQAAAERLASCRTARG